MRIWREGAYEARFWSRSSPLSLLAGLAAATGLARAEDAPQASPQACEVPAYLLNTESLLPKVTEGPSRTAGR